MAKLIKILIFGSIFLLVVAVTGAVALVALIDPNDYKEQITTEVKTATGRDLTLAGNLSWSFWPKLGVSMEQVSLSNAPGFGDQPFMSIGKAQVAVQVLPLLKKQVEMDALILHDAVINLARKKDGSSNWDDLAQGQADSAKTESPQAGGGEVASLALGGLDIKNSQLVWDDRMAGQKITLRKLNVSTGKVVMGQPIDLTLSVSAEVSEPQTAGDINLQGTISYDLENKVYALKPFQINADLTGANLPGGKAKFSLVAAIDADMKAGTAHLGNFTLNTLATDVKGDLQLANLLDSKPSVKGQLSVKGDDLAGLLRAVGQAATADQMSANKRNDFMMKTNVDADMKAGTAHLADFSIDIIGTEVRGDLQISNMMDAIPAVKGHLSVKGDDLPGLLRLAGQAERADKIKDSKYASFMLQTAMDTDMKTGNARLAPLSASLLGIKLDGEVNLSGINGDNPKVDGKLKLVGTELDTLLAVAGQEELAKTLKTINVDAVLSGSANDMQLKPLKLIAHMEGDAIPTKGGVDLEVLTTARANMEKQTLTVSELSVKGLGLNVKGNLNASQILDAKKTAFNGNLDVAQFNLRSLMQQTGQEVPNTADPKVLTRTAFSTAFSGTPNDIALSNLIMKLDDTSLKGDVSVKDFAQPAVAFKLALDDIDADRYLPPPAKDKPAKAATPGAAAGAATEIPLETLRSLNAKGSFTIGKLKLSNLRMTNINLNLDAAGGKIKLHPLSANLYQGSYAGNIQLDATGKELKLALDEKLMGVEAEPLLKDLQGEAKLRGTGDASAKLTASGTNPDGLKKTLNGNISFSFKDGAVKGFNIGQFLRKVKSFKGSGSLNVDKEEETDFAELTGNPVAKNGVITMDDLSAKSPALRIQGKGMLADLPADRIDYTIEATVSETSKGQGGKDLEELKGLTIPIKISGALADPKISPDIGGLALNKVKAKIEEKVQSQVTDKVKEKIGDKVGEEVGGALKKLFKF